MEGRLEERRGGISSDGEEAAQLAAKVLEALRLPFLVGSHEVFLTASLGVSIFPDDGGEIGRASWGDLFRWGGGGETGGQGAGGSPPAVPRRQPRGLLDREPRGQHLSGRWR